MSTIHLRFTTHIHVSPETIFDLIADLPNYSRWLPNSSAFGGTVNLTPYPVRLGTTYLDAGPIQKPGSVTGYARPKHISFRHTAQLSRDLLHADVDARILYTFDSKDGGTFVHRWLALQFYFRGISPLALPLLLYEFHKENKRILAALKQYVEAQPK